jgi:hypothetical protein
VPTIPLRRPRRAQRLEEALRERQEAETLVRTSQQYEEQVTSAIRSGASYAPPIAPSGWQPSSPTDDASEADDISS